MKHLPVTCLIFAGLVFTSNLSAHAQTKPLEWHDRSQAGIPYEVSVLIDPSCQTIIAPAGCTFEHTQISLPGDHTPYDTWHISYRAPGPVSSVHCEVYEHEHLLNETQVGNIARCDGLINGGRHPVRMVVHWKQQW